MGSTFQGHSIKICFSLKIDLSTVLTIINIEILVREYLGASSIGEFERGSIDLFIIIDDPEITIPIGIAAKCRSPGVGFYFEFGIQEIPFTVIDIDSEARDT